MSKEPIAIGVLVVVLIGSIGTYIATSVTSARLERQLSEESTRKERTNATSPPVSSIPLAAPGGSHEITEVAADAMPDEAPELLSVDAATPLVVDTDQRISELGERESELLARQEMMALLHADIMNEKAAIAETFQRMNEQLHQVSIAQAPADEPAHQPVATQNSDPATADWSNEPPTIVIPAPTQAPESPAAVGIIQKLVDNGDRSTVIKMLSMMQGRTAATVLDTLANNDAALAQELAAAVQAQKLAVRKLP